MQQKYAYNVTA